MTTEKNDAIVKSPKLTRGECLNRQRAGAIGVVAKALRTTGTELAEVGRALIAVMDAHADTPTGAWRESDVAVAELAIDVVKLLRNEGIPSQLRRPATWLAAPCDCDDCKTAAWEASLTPEERTALAAASVDFSDDDIPF